MSQANSPVHFSKRRNTLGRFFLATTLVFIQPVLAEGPDAKLILKAMSSYMGSQKSIDLNFDGSIEVITPQLEKIQFNNSGRVLLSRPDKLRAQRVGGHADVELVFDGKTVSILDKHHNAYTQFEESGNLDHLVDTLRAGYGFALPGGDLLLSNAYEALVASVLEAKYVGRGVIGGVECEHLAFRNFETDWQIWVEVGERPIPRKLVITSKTVNNAPQYTWQLTSWKAGFEPDAHAFSFKPPKGAQKLAVDALTDLDEIPQAAPTGGKP